MRLKFSTILDLDMVSYSNDNKIIGISRDGKGNSQNGKEIPKIKEGPQIV